MSSIRKIQIEQAYANVIRLLYTQGVKPSDVEISRNISKYFSQFPAGQPLPIRAEDLLAEGGRSDVEAFNEMMLRLNLNIDILYRATMSQVDDLMSVTTELNDKIKRLKTKRRALSTKIDDYLLGLYNTDGYFYSVSDSFSDIDLVDTSLTSAYIDVLGGSASLPIISRLSNRVPGDYMSLNNITGFVGDKPANINQISPFSSAVDMNTNTVWGCEVDSSNVSEAVVVAYVSLRQGVDISKIEISPYGSTESQWSVEYVTDRSTVYESFGNQIKTTGDRFALREPVIGLTGLKITIRKTRPDYEKVSGNNSLHRYIFGAKDILLSYQAYDTNATLVSMPLYVDADGGNMVIDAVSLVASETKPYGTSINYFIAEDAVGASNVSDFDWRQIQPVTENAQSTTIRFDGAQRVIKKIVENPGANDLQKIALDSSNRDAALRNPNTSIINGLNVYRLCKFEDDPLPNTLSIDEGINTTRIYHQPLSDFAVDGLEWWTDQRDSAQFIYSRIDVGNDFFYGGMVGESGRSIMVETYVDIPADIEPVVANFKKSDPNSKTWKIRTFLNGSEIGYLPTGTNEANLSWPFKHGSNHVAVLINIPRPTSAVPSPYVGTINMFTGGNLFDYGLVSLGSMHYTDPFDFMHNQTNSASTFTIVNKELIARRQPVGDLQVKYNKTTNQGPDAVRLRADFSRDNDFSNISPALSQYRLRFSYAGV